MIPARRLAPGLGLALLIALTGCTSDSGADPATGATGVPAAAGAAKDYAGYGSGPVVTATPPAGTVFGLSEPVSIAYWWGQNPASAPADLADYSMVFEEQATGPQVFAGPDVSRYDSLMTVLTCTEKVKYTVQVKTAKNPELATAAGDSCGGPQVAVQRSPALTGASGTAEFDVQVPATAKYYLTVYGKSAA